MHHMDANKTHREKARWELYKNASRYFEKKFLKATSNETTTAVRPLTIISKTIQVRQARHEGHCWRIKDEPIRDVFQRTSTLGRDSFSRLWRTYLHQLCTDTGWRLEDLLGGINDRDVWTERIGEIRAVSVNWWWWWWYHLICLVRSGNTRGRAFRTNLPKLFSQVYQFWNLSHLGW